MKRFLVLLALVCAPLGAQTALNPTNYPDSSVDTCEVLTWNGTDAKGVGFVGTNLCWDQSRTAWWIDGAADQIQWLIQAHSTNTNPVFTVEQSDGTDLMAQAVTGALDVIAPAITTEIATFTGGYLAAGNESTFDIGFCDQDGTGRCWGGFWGTDEEEWGWGAHDIAGNFCTVIKHSAESGLISGQDDATCGAGSTNSWQLASQVDGTAAVTVRPNKNQANVGLFGDASVLQLAAGGLGQALRLRTNYDGATGGTFIDMDEMTACPTSASDSGRAYLCPDDDGSLYFRNDAGTETALDQHTDVVDDTTPQLGGELDTNGQVISSAADESHLTVQGHTTQTNVIFTVEQSDGTDVFTVANDGTVTTGTGGAAATLDAQGANSMDYGSADVTDHTFTSDGTGTAEVVLPAGSIDSTEILDATIVAADVAASLDTEEYCYTRLDPVSDEEFFTVWRAPTAVTITEIYCEVTGGTSLDFDFEVDDGTPTGVNGSAITCTTSGVTDGTLAGDTAMADGDRLDIDTGTATGTQTQASFCIQFTRD